MTKGVVILVIGLEWLALTSTTRAQAPSDGAPPAVTTIQATGAAPGYSSQPPPGVEMIPPPTPLGPPPPQAPTCGQGLPPPGYGPALPPPYGPPPPLVPLNPDAPLGPWFVPNPAAPQRAWFLADFLYWWVSPGPRPPPLATNGNLNDANPGAFGQPGTTAILLGGQNLNFAPAGGLRIHGGYWFGTDMRWGIEAAFFYVAQETMHQRLDTDDNGNPGIFRPVNDINFGENAIPVALPNMASGFMSVTSSSELFSAEVNGLYRLVQRDRWNFNLLGGFRFLDLNESIGIHTFTNDFAGVLYGPANPGATPEVAGSTLDVTDRFRTSNQFYGGQMGFQTTYAFAGRWYVTGRLQVGLGDTHQTITINGSTVQNQPGVGMTTAPAGVLALASNSGRFSQDAFSVIPEAQLKIGWQLSRFTSIYLGYNFLYWSNVVRPGNQMSRTVDLQGVPTGINNPSGAANVPGPPPFAQSGFWAQGLFGGVQFTF